jgi:hypothetical protein
MCREITHIRDSDIGGQKGTSFNFVSGEVVRESQLSIGGGQLAEITRSCKLGGLQGERPKIGCSKSGVAKSRGARTTVGSEPKGAIGSLM